MNCNHNWTILLEPWGPDEEGELEFRPVTMDLRLTRRDYDFCRVKASADVGEIIQKETTKASNLFEARDGIFTGLSLATIKYNGEPVHRLMLRPDWITYGREYTHLKLQDLQKSLASGSVDIQRKDTELRDIYKEVLTYADTVFSDIRFNLWENQVRTLHGNIGIFGSQRYGRESENDITQRIVESPYAVDFDDVSPEKAIQRLNKKYGLTTWVNKDYEFIVGLPENSGIRHIAASDDERVWRYKDPSVNHSREPIKEVIVEGSWEDAAGIEQGPLMDWFSDGGLADAKVMGIATRTDVERGSRFKVKASNATKGAVEHVAELAIKERTRKQNSGNVEIDPDLSGTEESNPIDLRPGDVLRLVPEDDYFDFPTANSGQLGDMPNKDKNICGNFVNNEEYHVSGVNHRVTEDGNWQVHADIGLYPEFEPETRTSYFNPENEEWHDPDEFNGEDWWRFEDV